MRRWEPEVVEGRVTGWGVVIGITLAAACGLVMIAVYIGG